MKPRSGASGESPPAPGAHDITDWVPDSKSPGSVARSFEEYAVLGVRGAVPASAVPSGAP